MIVKRNESLRGGESMLRELFTNNDLLNVALLNIGDKKLSPGIDGIRVDEFDNFLKLNWDNIVEDIVDGKYFPKLVIEEEILSKKGRKRKIYKYCLIDVLYPKDFITLSS